VTVIGHHVIWCTICGCEQLHMTVCVSVHVPARACRVSLKWLATDGALEIAVITTTTSHSLSHNHLSLRITDESHILIAQNS